VAIEPGILIASFIESDETISDSLHASMVAALNAALGDADAIASASWHDEGRVIKGLVAHRSDEWLLVTVAAHDRDRSYIAANETTISLGSLAGVGLVTHRRFGTLPGGNPVEINFHSLHLWHQAFPGGKVFIDLDEGPHSEIRDEIVAAFGAACSSA
jgi:hypothetical protein